MKTTTLQAAKPEFQRTDVPCLYRYSSNGVYYALVRHEGKQKRASLKTTDKAVAKRLLADFRRDLGKVDTSQGRMTLRELCARYLATIASQAKDTVSLKAGIVNRLLTDFKPGADVQVAKVKISDLHGWVASYGFGYSSYNHYVQVIKNIFDIAVNDKIIASSPAAGMKGKKVVTPIRVTPTFEKFNAIVADVRKQKWNAEAQDSADYLEFMGLVGVGQAEAGGIQKQHVNIATKQLTFFRVKTQTPYVVPIFQQAEALVNKLINKPGMKPTDYLFPVNVDKSKNNSGTCTKDAKKSLAAACARLGLPAYTQRSLRRMFITRCIEKGVDVKVIAQWQGHKDGGKLILGTYSHVRNTHAEEMAKLLAVN
jgi:integrase